MRFILLFCFTLLTIGCGNSSNSDKNESNISQNLPIIKDRVYGKSLNQEIKIQEFQYTTLYMPKTIEQNKKIPIMLFLPGWGSQNHSSYKTLLSFIASQGYAVIYSISSAVDSADESIGRFSTVLQSGVSKYFDKSKFGVLGHSSGGGIAFKVLDYFSKNGYGDEGRFVFAMDPWFAFGMGEGDFENFPKDTKVVIQQFGDAGSTDARIALTIFDRVSVVGDENRDYQVYPALNHGYPFGNSYEDMQTILKPLDALMEYTFFKNQNGYIAALDIGSDKPYEDGLQIVKDRYDYPCSGLSSDVLKGLNYCSIIPNSE